LPNTPIPPLQVIAPDVVDVDTAEEFAIILPEDETIKFPDTLAPPVTINEPVPPAVAGIPA